MPTAIFGAMFELRVWLPCYVLLVFAVVRHAPTRSDEWWLASVFGDGPTEERPAG